MALHRAGQAQTKRIHREVGFAAHHSMRAYATNVSARRFSPAYHRSGRCPRTGGTITTITALAQATMTLAKMAAKSVSKRLCGSSPNPGAIMPTDGHQSGHRFYSQIAEFRGPDHNYQGLRRGTHCPTPCQTSVGLIFIDLEGPTERRSFPS